MADLLFQGRPQNQMTQSSIRLNLALAGIQVSQCRGTGNATTRRRTSRAFNTVSSI